MSNVRFDFSGLGKVQHNIGDFLERRAAVIGEELEQEAKRVVVVKSGKLRASIGHRIIRSGDNVTVQLYATEPYSRKVELGTHVKRASPFLRPSLITVFQRVGGLLKS